MDMINITLEGKEYQLDIEQAKKLGLLKEKDNKVKSWDEFRKKYKNVKGYWFDKSQGIVTLSCGTTATCEQLTSCEALALAAFSKLLKLRRDWIGEWEPDLKENDEKFLICRKNHHIIIFAAISTMSALSFPTQQMAKDFLDTFRDLIEEAKILI